MAKRIDTNESNIYFVVSSKVPDNIVSELNSRNIRGDSYYAVDVSGNTYYTKASSKRFAKTKFAEGDSAF